MFAGNQPEFDTRLMEGEPAAVTVSKSWVDRAAVDLMLFVVFTYPELHFVSALKLVPFFSPCNVVLGSSPAHKAAALLPQCGCCAHLSRA
jgi:hypothetical protein